MHSTFRILEILPVLCFCRFCIEFYNLVQQSCPTLPFSALRTLLTLTRHLPSLCPLLPIPSLPTPSPSSLQAPWWPAMVLASSESKIIPDSPHSVGTANISRIPSTICKQLIKLKAKFQSQEAKAGTSNLLTVPDGYALVEFFGTHDFGWVKQDTMMPMLFDGSLPCHGGKIGTVLCILLAALCCMMLHCNVVFDVNLLYATSHCTLLYCTVLHYAALYCTALHCTTLHYTELNRLQFEFNLHLIYI